MPRRPLLGIAAVGLLGLAGCAGPVEVEPPSSHASSSASCDALLDDVPSSVDGQDAREVEPAGAGAAWGDPPIVLRCGVAKPDALEPTSRCAELNDVGWFAQEREDAYIFTTIGRETYVQVRVPQDYDPQADALIDLAEAVKRNVRQVRDCV